MSRKKVDVHKKKKIKNAIRGLNKGFYAFSQVEMYIRTIAPPPAYIPHGFGLSIREKTIHIIGNFLK